MKSKSKVSIININPLTMSILHIEIAEKPRDDATRNGGIARLEAFIANFIEEGELYPVDVFVIPRLDQGPSEDERIDIAAAIHRRLMLNDEKD